MSDPTERVPTRIDYEGVDHPGSDIFFAAVSTTRMPMIVTDPRKPDNPIIFANPAFLRMTGYSTDELIGRNCRLLQGPGTDRVTIAAIRDAVAAKQEIATEILNYRRDGSTFWNALFVSPVYDGKGEVVYFFASQLDVSRRRDAEDALRQAQKMEALGQLTGGIAHDFNNLLQLMIGYVESVEVGLTRPQIERDKLLRFIAGAKSGIQRASTLTSQLLAFSRKQTLQGRVVNPNQVVADMQDMLERSIGADIDLELDLAPDTQNARLDPTQLEVALLNVSINARDAMEGRAGKRLTLRTRNATPLEINNQGELATRGDAFVAIDVIDNGSGMAPDVAARVMDPFFTTKPEGKGTGLGLSMVYGFAKQSGGAVAVSSEEGRGTTLTMYFPVATETDGRGPQPVRRIDRAADREGHERVVVVDDREDLAELARTILESHGYRVEAFTDPQKALQRIGDDLPFDILFTDIVMPGDLDGVSLARRARAIRPGVKVLLTTGYASQSLQRTDAGGIAFDVLSKPYSRIDLLRKIRFVLDGPTGVS
ncbi:MAG: histidine kinase famiy protein [Luteibacter sp.]|uniref:histidine kinase famiy protein n=1 Tax=Luteibacter sp. TaxID=1886636 RepID=UPI0028093C20|nr:histidine kinase famiy protein [Luteibacter sp.]MDQ7994968.1 histidine kinase famiy protein [Luteibacter sp.]MDQ8047516.1 histidine kinase famiy protein [Luteibacter sp.]